MGIAEKLFGSARDRFGKEVAARVRAVDAVASAEYDPEKFQVVYHGAQGTEPAVINLETVFRETRGRSAAARREAIGRLADIAALPPTPEDWADVQAALRPVLRPVPADPKFDIVSRPAARYLAEMLVLDTPSAMRYAGRADLKRWGVSAEEAFATAHRNMARTVTASLNEARRRAATASSTGSTGGTSSAGSAGGTGTGSTPAAEPIRLIGIRGGDEHLFHGRIPALRGGNQSYANGSRRFITNSGRIQMRDRGAGLP